MSDTNIGQQYVQPDARGWLVFHGLHPDLQKAEDATQAADHAYQRQTGRRRWSRPATPTERLLLAHLGYTLPEGLLATHIDYTTDSLRRRTWPTLESQQPEGISA
jgi:hypothetical protein